MRRPVRTLHRWLSPVFVIGLLVSLLLSGSGVQEDSPVIVGLGVVVVAAILSLTVTGVVMLIQHYAPRWRRRTRVRQRSAA